MKAVKARDGETLIPLQSDEMAKLLAVSEGRPVSGRFGTGGTAIVVSQAPWAVPLLAQWRGEAFNEGAGI